MTLEEGGHIHTPDTPQSYHRIMACFRPAPEPPAQRVAGIGRGPHSPAGIEGSAQGRSKWKTIKHIITERTGHFQK